MLLSQVCFQVSVFFPILNELLVFLELPPLNGHATAHEASSICIGATSLGVCRCQDAILSPDC